MIWTNASCVAGARPCATVYSLFEAISAINRGFNSIISTGFGEDIELGNCTYCGQCVAICPVGALGGKSSVDQVLDVLADSSKVVVAQTARQYAQPWGKLLAWNLTG